MGLEGEPDVYECAYVDSKVAMIFFTSPSSTASLVDSQIQKLSNLIGIR